jgi:hypothetical protein
MRETTGNAAPEKTESIHLMKERRRFLNDTSPVRTEEH